MNMRQNISMSLIPKSVYRVGVMVFCLNFLVPTQSLVAEEKKPVVKFAAPEKFSGSD